MLGFKIKRLSFLSLMVTTLLLLSLLILAQVAFVNHASAQEDVYDQSSGLSGVDLDFVHHGPVQVSVEDYSFSADGFASSGIVPLPLIWQRSWSSQAEDGIAAYQARVQAIDFADEHNKSIIAISLNMDSLPAEPYTIYYWPIDDASAVLSLDAQELHARKGILPWQRSRTMGLELHLQDELGAPLDISAKLLVHAPKDDQPVFIAMVESEEDLMLSCKNHLLGDFSDVELYLGELCAEHLGVSGYYHYYDNDAAQEVQWYFSQDELQISEEGLNWFAAEELIYSNIALFSNLMTSKSKLEQGAGSVVVLQNSQTRYTLIAEDEGLYIRSADGDLAGDVALSEQDSLAVGLLTDRTSEADGVSYKYRLRKLVISEGDKQDGFLVFSDDRGNAVTVYWANENQLAESEALTGGVSLWSSGGVRAIFLYAPGASADFPYQRLDLYRYDSGSSGSADLIVPDNYDLTGTDDNGTFTLVETTYRLLEAGYYRVNFELGPSSSSATEGVGRFRVLSNGQITAVENLEVVSANETIGGGGGGGCVLAQSKSQPQDLWVSWVFILGCLWSLKTFFIARDYRGKNQR